MKCSYCGEEICQDENFYIVSDQICCEKCCEENTHTYYIVCDETYEEDEVTPFENKEEAIENYQEDIILFKKCLAEMEHSDSPYKNIHIKRYMKKIEEAQQLIDMLKEDEEEIYVEM